MLINIIKIINLIYIKLSEMLKIGNRNNLTGVQPETKRYRSEKSK